MDSPILFYLVKSDHVERDIMLKKDDFEELEAIVGETKKVKVRGKIWKITACPLSDIPTLQKLIRQFESLNNEEVIMERGRVLMAEIIWHGIKEEHSKEVEKEKVMDHFTLGAFPVILNIMLDLNDFLSGMREVRNLGQAGANLAAPSGSLESMLPMEKSRANRGANSKKKK